MVKSITNEIIFTKHISSFGLVLIESTRYSSVTVIRRGVGISRRFFAVHLATVEDTNRIVNADLRQMQSN